MIFSTAALAFVLAMLLLGLVLQAAVGRRAATAVDEMLNRYLGQAGSRFSWRSLSPSFLGRLQIHDLEIHLDDHISLTVPRLSLGYRLNALLRQDYTRALSTLVLEGARLSLRLDAPEEARSLADWGGVDWPDLGWLAAHPFGQLRLELRNAELSLAGDGVDALVRLRRLQASLDGLMLRYRLDGRLAAGLAIGPLERGQLSWAVQGSLDMDSWQAEARLQVQAQTSLGSLSASAWRLVLDGDAVSLALLDTPSLPELAVDWRWLDRSLSLRAVLRGFRPNSLVQLNPVQPGLSPWLATAYSGSLNLGLHLDSLDSWQQSVRLSGSLTATLPLDLPGGRPRADIAFSGRPDRLDLSRANLSTTDYSLGYRGLVQPFRLGAEGRLNLEYRHDRTSLAKAELEVYAIDGSIFAYAETMTLLSAELRDLTLSVLLEDQELYYLLDAKLPVDRPASVLAEEEEELRFDWSIDPARHQPSLSLEGSLWFGQDPYLSTQVQVDSLSLEPFLRDRPEAVPASLAPLLRRLRLSSDFSLFSNFEAVSYYANNLVLAMEGDATVFAVLGLRGNRDVLELHRINASIGSYAVRGSSSLDFSDPNGLQVLVDVAVNDIPYALNASIEAGNLFIIGDYGLVVRLQTYDEVISGIFRSENLPVELFDQVLLFSSELSMRFVSLQDWTALLSHLVVESPSGLGQPGRRLELSGQLNQDGALLPGLALYSAEPLLSGELRTQWRLTGQPSLNGSLRLSDGGREQYQLTAGYQDGRLALELGLSQARLSRFLPKESAYLDLSLRSEGPLFDPAISLDFSMLPDRRGDSRQLSAAGSAAYASGQLSLRELRLELPHLKASNLNLDVDLIDGQADYSAAFAFRLTDLSKDTTFSGHTRGSLALWPETDAPRGERPARDNLAQILSNLLSSAVDRLSLAGRVEDYLVHDRPAAAWPYTLSLGPEGLALRAGEADELSLRTDPGGRFQLDLDPRLPLAGRVAGFLGDAAVSIQADDLAISMPFLFRSLGLPFVEAVSGIGRGSLVISGSSQDPHFSGGFDFDDFRLRVDEYVSEVIGSVTQPLVVEGQRAELSQFDLRCGNALLSLQLGLDFNGWIPSTVSVDVATRPGSLVHARTRLLGMQIEAMASTELAIRVSPAGSRIDGSINASQGEVVITLDVLSQSRQQETPANNLVVNLNFSLGRSVRIFFPDKLWPILAGQSDPSSRLSVYYDSNRDDLAVRGAIRLRGGNVFYIKRNFYLKNAVIQFDEDLFSFNPLLSLEAETRSSYNGQPIVISLRSQATPLASLAFSLVSSPPLPELEIARLLGQDLLGTDEERSFDIGRALIENTDIILPQLNVVSIFEQNIQNFFGFDLFYLRTQVLQRWLYDVSGLNPLDAPMTLAQYLDNTAIIAGKYLADDLFLQGSLLLQEGQLEQQGNLQLNYELSLEWQTPHFLINWSFRPQNPENLFISDQTLSLYWRIPLK